MPNFKLTATIIFLFTLACSPKKDQLKENEELSQVLMRDLEAYLMKGDTVQYNLQRKEIEKTIKLEDNKKLELYFETHDALKLINNGNLSFAKYELKRIFQKAEIQKEYFTMFTTTSNYGNILYFEGDVKGALESWKKAANIAKKNELNEYVASTYGNIAVAYLEMGYYNTASRYFLKVKKFMEKTGVKNENYWTNHINIANVYLTMNLPEMAIDFLRKTKINESSKVRYLYYANMASAYSNLNNQKLTEAYLDSTRMLSTANPEYKQDLLEEEIESYIQFNLNEKLNKTINHYLSDNSNKSIPLKCMFNKAYFKLNNTYYDRLDSILNWENLIEKSDFKTNEAYFSFVAEVYENLGDYKNQNAYLKKFQSYQTKIIDEKLKNQFEDNLLSQKTEKFQSENKILALRNKTKEAQINKQRIVFLLIVTLLIASTLLILLLYFNTQKSKILKEQELQLAHKRILEKDRKTEDLLSEMNLQQEKLESIVLIINKISILKKQLDDFFETVDRFELDENFKTKVKSAKLDFKSFFSVYSDLAVQASSLDEFSERMKRVPTIAFELNKKEIQVAQLIINKYTTKEIALLLSRSVKNIEFTRSEIRKKLNIPNDVGLNEFLQNI